MDNGQPLPSRAPREHMPQLDGLRALAVLAVIAHHTLPDRLIHALNPGAAGVRLFFVLSGFLITGILLRARDVTEHGASPGQALRSFYARRFLRIFPLYYFALALVLFLGVREAREGAAWHLSYMTNVYGVLHGRLGHLAHFWSLAVEEQFYLVWPALVLFLPRPWLGPLFVVSAVAGPLARSITYLLVGDPSLACILMPSCLDSLGMGAILAYVGRERGPVQAGRLSAAGRAIGLPFLLAVDIYRLARGEDIVTVALRDAALALVAVWIVHEAARGLPGTAGRLLSSRPLVYLGAISYGIYVWHGLVPALAEHAGLTCPEAPGPAKFLFVTAVSVALASLTWHVFERPLNELKRCFPYAGPERLPGEARVGEVGACCLARSGKGG